MQKVNARKQQTRNERNCNYDIIIEDFNAIIDTHLIKENCVLSGKCFAQFGNDAQNVSRTLCVFCLIYQSVP